MKALALLLLLLGGDALPSPPGRLFFTPEERRQIDQRPPPPSAPGRLDGLLRGPGGRVTTWIDGETRSGNAPPLRVGDSPQHPLLPPGSLRIEPGRERR